MGDRVELIPTKLLRDAIKVLHHTSGKPDRLRPYTKHGGVGGKNNHNTRRGLVATLVEEIGNDTRVWLDKTIFLRTYDWQETPVAERLRRYARPILVSATNPNFNELWLEADNITTAVRGRTWKRKSFHMLGSYSMSENDGKVLISEFGKYVDQYNRLGMAFNTGNHWVAAFVNVQNGTIWYLDSFGGKIPNPIHILLSHMSRKLSRKMGRRVPIYRNKKRIQQNGYQCGVYACYYLINLAENKDAKTTILKSNDELMKDRREAYFDQPTDQQVEDLRRMFESFQIG